MSNYGKQKIGKVPGPAVHQQCVGCGKSLPIRREDKPVGPQYGLTFEYTGRWKYNGYGAFCTQICATGWANRMAANLGKAVPKRDWQEDERP